MCIVALDHLQTLVPTQNRDNRTHNPCLERVRRKRSGIRQAANDKQQMVPLVEAIEEQSGQKPKEVLADSGYCSDDNLKYLQKKKAEGYVATEKEKHGERREPCKRGPLPQGATRVERMERKLETKVGAAVYATRKVIVEPVFGQIKQARGFRQFLLRGLEKVRGEWALICMTHNILKFHKMCSGWPSSRCTGAAERP